ncbi:hypothetical protein K8T06_00575, partial [bacterium]|nr:hypothetical protein [bacterium]
MTQTLIEQYTQITSHRLMDHVNRLSAEGMRGRMPGDIGYIRAMDYVVNCLDNYGLLPAFAGADYTQSFTMETCRILDSQVFLALKYGAREKLILGKDYVCRGLTGDGDVSGDLVFVGYCSTEEDYNELDSINLEGKIAVSFKHPPLWRQFQ